MSRDAAAKILASSGADWNTTARNASYVFKPIPRPNPNPKPNP
jgi:hypothetical protein